MVSWVDEFTARLESAEIDRDQQSISGRCLCQRFASQVLRIPPSVGAGSFDMPRLRSIRVRAVESRELDCHWVRATSQTRTQPVTRDPAARRSEREVSRWTSKSVQRV